MVLILDNVRDAFELKTEIKICECHQCKKFYLKETEQHKLISLSKHGEVSTSVSYEFVLTINIAKDKFLVN